MNVLRPHYKGPRAIRAKEGSAALCRPASGHIEPGGGRKGGAGQKLASSVKPKLQWCDAEGRNADGAIDEQRSADAAASVFVDGLYVKEVTPAGEVKDGVGVTHGKRGLAGGFLGQDPPFNGVSSRHTLGIEQAL